MSPTAPLRLPEPNVPYEDDEVRQFPRDRQPTKFEPYRIDHAAPGQGRAIKRLSSKGDRWCPFCQTLLVGRRQACEECREARLRNPRTSNADGDSPAADSLDPVALDNLYEAADELSRTVGLINARTANKINLTKTDLMDLMAASKTVMLAAEAIKRGQGPR